MNNRAAAERVARTTLERPDAKAQARRLPGLEGLGLCLFIAGCASGPHVSDVIRVQVPTVCIDSVPTKPTMLSDAQLLALDDYALIIALAQDRRVRQGWEATIEALVAGCR